jgi:hypothetical protein
MTEPGHEHRGVLEAIAAWVKRYREVQGLRSEMANCTPEQVATIARDMGITSGELLWVTAKGTTRRRRTAAATPCARSRSR